MMFYLSKYLLLTFHQVIRTCLFVCLFICPLLVEKSTNSTGKNTFLVLCCPLLDNNLLALELDLYKHFFFFFLLLKINLKSVD